MREEEKGKRKEVFKRERVREIRDTGEEGGEEEFSSRK